MIDEQVNSEVTVILLKKIIELLGVKDEPANSIGIDNLDEVKAHLRNELAPVIKSIKSIPDNSDIVKALKTLSDKFETIEFNPTINVAAADVSIPEIKVPEINVPSITVPTPQVTVNAPEVLIPAPIVNIPAPIVNVEAINLDSIIKELERNLRPLRINNVSHPLAVRLSDGGTWIKELIKVQKETSKAVAAFAGGNDQIRLLDSNRSFVNPASAEGQSYMLVPKIYDYISLSPASLPTTVVYKTGGASGTTVATLTIVYSGTDISTVTRS